MADRAALRPRVQGGVVPPEGDQLAREGDLALRIDGDAAPVGPTVIARILDRALAAARRLGDALGRRRLFMLALSAFVLFSALAQDHSELILPSGT